MTLFELRKVYNDVLKKQENSQLIYQNYVYMKSISNKQEKLLAILHEGIEFYNAGMFTAAYETFTEAIAVEADADAYYNRGTACMDLSKFGHAIHDFTAAIMFCPTYEAPYMNRGLCVAQVLSNNNAISDPEYKDIKDFAKADLRKSSELGNIQAMNYLNMIDNGF